LLELTFLSNCTLERRPILFVKILAIIPNEQRDEWTAEWLVNELAGEDPREEGYEELRQATLDMLYFIESKIPDDLEKALDAGLAEIIENEGYQEMADGFSQAMRIVRKFFVNPSDPEPMYKSYED
jgi:hypothetical protein